MLPTILETVKDISVNIGDNPWLFVAHVVIYAIATYCAIAALRHARGKK